MNPPPDNLGLAIAALFAIAVCRAAITTEPTGDTFERWWCRGAGLFSGFLLVVIIHYFATQ